MILIICLILFGKILVYGIGYSHKYLQEKKQREIEEEQVQLAIEIESLKELQKLQKSYSVLMEKRDLQKEVLQLKTSGIDYNQWTTEMRVDLSKLQNTENRLLELNEEALSKYDFDLEEWYDSNVEL